MEYKVGDKVLWNDRELRELGDDRVWQVYDVRDDDTVCICSGEIGEPGYSEAEVPISEIIKITD